MATNFQNGYPYPVIPISGSVVTSGQFGDLKQSAGAVSTGIYDAQTYGISTGSGNGKEYFIGYSSEHTVDQLTFQMSGMKNPRKTQVFKGSDVISFEFTTPQKAQNEVWVYGYNGAPSSKSLSFKSNSVYGIMIDLEGNPIFRTFGKTLRHEIWISTDPVADSDCTIGCQEGVDCEKYTQKFADAINNHVELSKLGIKARARISSYTSPTDTITVYRLVLTDGCSDQNLAAVQAAVGRGKEVKVISKADCTTTYEVCSSTLPPAITPPQQYTITNCSVCPSGYTLVAAQDTYVINRPLAGNEDFTSANNKDTYADTVGTAYGVSVDADKIFLGTDGATATVQIRVAAGATAPTPLVADTIQKVASVDAYCISNVTPAAVAWTSFATAFRKQRSLTMSLARVNCNGVSSGSNRLAEVTAFVAQFSDYVTGSITVSTDNDNCVDDYTISQWSQGCAGEGCLDLDGVTYLDFPGIDGNVFRVAPVADLAETGKKCGLEVFGGFVDTKYGNCSFDPTEYYENEPIRIRLTGLTNYPWPTQLAIAALPTSIQTVIANTARQSGEYILREYIKAGAYEPWSAWLDTPRMREALNSRRQEQVDRNAYYKIYYLKYKALRTGTDQKAELFETMFAIKETEIGKQQAFESAMLAALSKHGVVLKQRDI